MGLSIKNAEVERMLREVAGRRGRRDDRGAAAGAGGGAGAAAGGAGGGDRGEAAQAVREIAPRVAAMPDVSDMTDDEILGYDEDGIPSR